MQVNASRPSAFRVKFSSQCYKVNRPRYQAIFAAQPEHRSGSTYGPYRLSREQQAGSVADCVANVRAPQLLPDWLSFAPIRR